MDLVVGTARQSTDREWRGSIVSVHASTEVFLELYWLHSSVRSLALDAIRSLSSSETTGCKIRKCKGDRVVVSSVSVPRSCLRSVRRGIPGCGIAPLRRRNIVPQRRKQHRVCFWLTMNLSLLQVFEQSCDISASMRDRSQIGLRRDRLQPPKHLSCLSAISRCGCSQGANWRDKCGSTVQIAVRSFSRRKG
jgi:hypothetical protein